MSYYMQKRRFLIDVSEIIQKVTKDKVEFSINKLSLTFGEKYGYSKGTLLRLLQQYEQMGVIKIKGDDVVGI